MGGFPSGDSILGTWRDLDPPPGFPGAAHQTPADADGIRGSRKAARSCARFLRGFLLGRRAVRNSKIGVIAFSSEIGAVVGLITASLHQLVSLLHEWAFAPPPNTHLSAEVHTSTVPVILVPLIGALLLGIARRISPRDGTHAIVDPIEANAHYGGRMSMRATARGWCSRT